MIRVWCHSWVPHVRFDGEYLGHGPPCGRTGALRVSSSLLTSTPHLLTTTDLRLPRVKRRTSDSRESKLCVRFPGGVKGWFSCALFFSRRHTAQSQPHPWVSELEIGKEARVRTRGKQRCEASGSFLSFLCEDSTARLFLQGEGEDKSLKGSGHTAMNP